MTIGIYCSYFYHWFHPIFIHDSLVTRESKFILYTRLYTALLKYLAAVQSTFIVCEICFITNKMKLQLVELDSADNNTAEITCRRIYANLNSPPDYEAISYE